MYYKNTITKEYIFLDYKNRSFNTQKKSKYSYYIKKLKGKHYIIT